MQLERICFYISEELADLSTGDVDSSYKVGSMSIKSTDAPCHG